MKTNSTKWKAGRQREHGGVMLYLLIPVVLVAGAAGLLFVFKDSETVKPLKEALRPTLSKFGLMSPTAGGASGEGGDAANPLISDVTGTQLLTVAELYGDLDKPAIVTLDNIRKSQRTQSERELELKDRMQRLLHDEAELKKKEEQLKQWTDKAEAAIDKQARMDQQRQEYLSSERVKRIRDLSATLLKLSPKNSAQIFSEMWGKSEEDKIIVIETLRTLAGGKKSKILDAMAKSSPQDAADILARLVTDEENDPGAGPS